MNATAVLVIGSIRLFGCHTKGLATNKKLVRLGLGANLKFVFVQQRDLVAPQRLTHELLGSKIPDDLSDSKSQGFQLLVSEA